MLQVACLYFVSILFSQVIQAIIKKLTALNVNSLFLIIEFQTFNKKIVGWQAWLCVAIYQKELFKDAKIYYSKQHKMSFRQQRSITHQWK